MDVSVCNRFCEFVKNQPDENVALPCNMVGRLLQNSEMYICMQQSILIQLQHRIFSFNDYIESTSTRAIFV